MAEESIDSLVTPEKTESHRRRISNISDSNLESLSNGRRTHVNPRRASIGSYRAGDSIMRNSIDKSDSANGGQNEVPHYLRASTGSCHDLCKYGRKHSFEEKPWKSLRRRSTKPSADELRPVQITVSGDRNKERLVDDKPATDTDDRPPDLNQSPDTKSYSRKSKTSLDKEKTVKRQPSTPDLPLPGSKSYSRTLKTSLDKERIAKHKPSGDIKNHIPDLTSPGTKYLQKPKMSSDAKAYSARRISSGKRTILPKYKPSSTQKSPSPDPPEIVKSVSFPAEKVEDPVKQGSSTDNKISGGEKKTTYLSKQHSSPMKLKPVKLKPSSSSDNPHGAQGRKNINEETGRTIRVAKIPAKKIPASTTAISSPKLSVIKAFDSGRAGSLKLVPALKDRNRTSGVKTKTTNNPTKRSNNQKVSEKTLHVIKTETKNNVLKSRVDDLAISSLPSSSSDKSLSHGKTSSSSSPEEDEGETEYSGGEGEELISDNHEIREIGKVPPIKENHKKYLRKSRVVVSEEKYSSPVKLKFRIGKVVDLKSDNNTPRRLRFRRARVVGAEDGKGDSRRRTFKNAGANDDGPQISSEKVVLKHQDVRGKKDAQGLFNNVIEETASKLVESRKSKVKALVGAFETVISLQDTKPSLQAVG